MMAVLDYFIEIIFLFCNLIVGKTKINKHKRQKKTERWERGGYPFRLDVQGLIGVFVSHLVLAITTWMPHKYFCSLS